MRHRVYMIQIVGVLNFWISMKTEEFPGLINTKGLI